MFGPVRDLPALHATEVFRIVGNDKRSHRPRSDHKVSGPELSPTVLQVCPGIGVRTSTDRYLLHTGISQP